MVAAEQVLAYSLDIQRKVYSGWKEQTCFFDLIKQSGRVYEKTQAITSYDILLWHSEQEIALILYGELYAAPKTWHLLASASRLVARQHETVHNSVLELCNY